MPVTVDLEIQEPPEAPPDGEARAGRRSTSVTVRERAIEYVDRRGRHVVLDFDRRRRLLIDAAARTYVDESLFIDVGVRHHELPNRAVIRRVIEAGGGDGGAFGPVLVEHQLSVRDAARKTTIEGPPEAGREDRTGGGWRALFRPRPPLNDIAVRSDGGEVGYSAGGRRLLTHGREGLTGEGPGETAAVAAAITQLVRYEGGGHPLILARIAGLGFVPREIRVEALQPDGFDRGPWILRPTSFRRSQAAPPSTDGLREVAGLDGTEPADALLAISRPAPLATGDEALAPRLGAAIAAIRSDDALAGTLAFLELTLETGVPMPAELSEAVRACWDGRVKVLFASLASVRDADGARLALATQLKLRISMPEPSPALDIFEAETRMKLGERPLAKELLTRALTHNPRLVGAYADLGDVYFSSYDGRRAWRCWDVARALAPLHPILRGVDKLEKILLAEHPEYFA